MGKNRQISNISDVATEVVNTTGVRTPVLEISPTDGTALIFYNRADGAKGIPIYGRFQDLNGNPLPLDTEVALEFESNIDDSESAVSDVQDTIQPWRARSIADQQNEEFVDSVRVPLKGSRVNVREVDTLYLSVKSSVQIDWVNSAVYIDKRHVEEVSED